MAHNIDIPLSAKDFEEMNPDDLKGVYDALRESWMEARGAVQERDEAMARRAREMQELQLRLQQALAREERLRSKMVRVGEKLIDLGALDALMLNIQNPEDAA